MSIETHVFFRGSLPPVADLRNAIQELGFPFVIDETVDSLEGQDGFMPMARGEEETGCEFDVHSGPDAIEDWTEFGVDPSYEHVANLRWGSDYQEAVAGMCTAAALAKLLGDSVVYDEAEDRLMNVEEAIEAARNELRNLREGDRE